MRPSGNFRIAIIEAGVSSLMENYASLRTFVSKRFKGNERLLSQRPIVSFFRKGEFVKTHFEKSCSKGIFNA